MRFAIDEIVTLVDKKIDHAYELAAAGDIVGAVEVFDEVRNFGETPDLKERVDKLENDFLKTVAAERDAFRSYVKQGNPVDPDRRILIFADSLGLPRPGDPSNVVDNQATSYAFALREAVKRRHKDGAPKAAVDPICQRYATSATVLENMPLAQIEGADVIVHVGLNDFSRRIFLERQRLSLKLLPNALVNKIVKFSQVNMHRADIIRRYDQLCYTPLDKWVKNIAEIAGKAKSGGARSLTWFTMVQLPMRVEAHTPSYRYNVLSYNLALYAAEKSGAIKLLDLDRMFWERGFETLMHSDLMHLSQKAHLFVCNRMIEQLFDVDEYTFKE
jgi:hypothetical protein